MLTVDATDAPGFARVFAPDTIRQGGETQIVFTVDNRANAIGMTGMAFDDALPAGVSVAATPGAGNSCGGTFSPSAGDTVLALTGGALAAGATCELRVTVRAITAGTLTGPDVALTSSVATATAAEATLNVTAADAPGFAKAFSPDTVDPGEVSTLTFTIDNGANLIDVGSLAFTDNFPNGMIVADTPDESTTCGDGAVSAPAGGDTVSLSGGTVAAGQSCTISVRVQALRAGALENVSGDLTSDLPVTTPGASAMLTVNEAPLTASMAFDPDTIAQGGVSTLSYTLNNSAAVGATSVSLEDTLPANVTVAATPNAETTCTGGALNAAAGGDTITFTGGALAAGATCAISVDVTSALAGTYPNETGSVTSSLGASAPAEATLTVDEAAPLSVSMAFEPTAIRAGGVSTLSYTLSNGALIEATSVSLSDTLPAGMAPASDPDASTSCSGALTAPAGGNTISFTGGVLAAGETCMISVDVTSALAGTYLNETGSVTSSLGASAPAAAMLTVDATDAPGFARVFAPDTIRQGGETQIVFTVDNGANAIGMTGMAFDDALPAGVSVAATPGAGNSCGGTFSPSAGDTVLALTGGALAAGATCELRVTVRAITAGTLTGPDVALTSSVATATAAEAMLNVTAADAPGFAKAFRPPRSIRARFRR